MSRVHDLAGTEGLPAPRDLSGDDPDFTYDWQAHIFAIHRVLSQKGIYTLDEFRDSVETIPPAEYLELGYYERWVAAIPQLLQRKGVIVDEVPREFDDHH